MAETHAQYVVHVRPSPDSAGGRILATITAEPGLTATAIAARLGTRAWKVLQRTRDLRRRHQAIAVRAVVHCEARGYPLPQWTWYPAPAPAARRVVSVTRCETPVSHDRRCQAKLVEQIDALGRVSWSCPACVRRAQGFCRTCPRPTPARKSSKGRPAWFCTHCASQRSRRLGVRKRTYTDAQKQRTRERKRERARQGVTAQAARP